jgi:hypothetical protein
MDILAVQAQGRLPSPAAYLPGTHAKLGATRTLRDHIVARYHLRNVAVEAVDIALVLAVDSSGSISGEDRALQQYDERMADHFVSCDDPIMAVRPWRLSSRVQSRAVLPTTSSTGGELLIARSLPKCCLPSASFPRSYTESGAVDLLLKGGRCHRLC